MSEGSTYVGLGERMSQRMAPSCNWTDMGSGAHFVQFFEADDYIIGEVSEYVIHGLRANETVVVVATAGHIAGISQILESLGIDLEHAEHDGSFVALDAHETLDQILSNGSPDKEKFNKVVGTIIAKAGERRPGVRVFGEMVGVLCSSNRYDCAVKLEDMWNDLRRKHVFSLFCGYSISDLKGSGASEKMGAICASHGHVLPTEAYSEITNTNERLKLIAMLQQRNVQLEAEIAELEIKIAERQSTNLPGDLLSSLA
jgi:hypothetical protein